jgi:hypothetical protein
MLSSVIVRAKSTTNMVSPPNYFAGARGLFVDTCIDKKDLVMKENLSNAEIQKTISQLADPAINLAVNLASTSYVAKRIIERLPGVEDLKTSGPEVEKALLEVIGKEESLHNENFTSIVLRILESYPTNRVKLGLAKLLVSDKVYGRNLQFAAEGFLKAAGIEPASRDIVGIARREARNLLDLDDKQKASPKDRTQTYTKNK